jgi:ribosomal protein RSM22 (predicted rRNA methylase)
LTSLPAELQVGIHAALDTLPFSRLQGIVDELLPAYRDGESAPPIIDSEAKAIAYAVYRLPGTFAAVSRVLREAAATVPGLDPASMVDVGGGSGAAAWAAAGALPGLRGITVLDRSRAALALGERLAAAGPEPIAQAEWKEHFAGSSLPSADLAVAADLLGELTPADRSGLVRHMATAAATVAVVEPGTPAGYRRVIVAREALIESGMSVAAPCPHESRCPLLGEDWCHFSVRFERSPELRRLKRAEHGYEDEKFSYVVGTRLPIGRPPARVIRHPQYRGKMVTLELCRADGTAVESVVTRSQGDAYRRARTVRWGDPWP